VYDFEVYILLIMALFFTTLYEIGHSKKRDYQNDYLWSGIFASIIWIVIGLTYFVGAASNTPQQPYVIALLPWGIGMFYIIRFMVDLIDVRRISRELT